MTQETLASLVVAITMVQVIAQFMIAALGWTLWVVVRSRLWLRMALGFTAVAVFVSSSFLILSPILHPSADDVYAMWALLRFVPVAVADALFVSAYLGALADAREDQQSALCPESGYAELRKRLRDQIHEVRDDVTRLIDAERGARVANAGDNGTTADGRQ